MENLVYTISSKVFEGSSPNLTWYLPMTCRQTDKVILENLVYTISSKGIEGSSPNLTWYIPMTYRQTDQVFKVVGSKVKVT